MRALIRVTAWERKSPWRRILAALIRVGTLIAFLAVLIELLGPPIAIFITTRMEARKVPAVKIAPQALADYSVSNSAGTTLSYFGYEFEVPWNTSFKQKASGQGTTGKGIAQLQFDSGQNVTFIVPVNQRGFLTDIVQDKASEMGYLRWVFGDLLDRSAYDQYGALLNTTPRSIRAFGPRAEAVRGVTLLTIKAIAVGPGLETGAFSFALPGKRGFQVGDPQKSRRVDLQVFDSTGHHIEILCSAANGNVRFSQSELNRILTSLHPTTDSAHVSPFLGKAF
jgi:hypothetical protein